VKYPNQTDKIFAKFIRFYHLVKNYLYAISDDETKLPLLNYWC